MTEQPEFEKKWVFGGDFGLGFSNYGTNIMVSPQVGYRITPDWEFGTRLTYNYYSYNQNRLKFATHNYGGGFYTTYEIYRGIFAHMENELLSYERVYYNSNFDITNRERLTIHSVFVGGGIRQYFSGRAFVTLTILYNLNETPNTPYTNPMFRIGFGFGL
ncbi:MAG: hypothetical protein PHG67_13390 [Bacteroidales bacterium]|nr:hypothetical protein [Bacteroidales bacterium]HOI31456.1 hypothetical protein [Bacteroidales bacterium]